MNRSRPARRQYPYRKPLIARPQPLARWVRMAAFALGAGLPLAALAGPEGGTVVGGSGAITRPDARTTAIRQDSARLAIDWQRFNVGADETVRFQQPSASAAALNRILDQNPSQILGRIQANGQVFLLNPNGVLIGRTARLNVGSLVVGGFDAKVEDFMAGRMTLTGSGGRVVNEGTIEAAAGGSVILTGGSVENSGRIVADYGSVTLAAGRQATLDFDGDGLMRFAVSGESLTKSGTLVANRGEIHAEGGQVLLTARGARDVASAVVNNSGVVRAGRIEEKGGVIRLVGSGGGGVVNTGTLDASQRGTKGDGGTIEIRSDADTRVAGGSRVRADSALGKGGSVDVLGERVAVYGDAQVSARGRDGGGRIRVGGDYQGRNPDLPNAKKTVIGSGAQLDASATGNGDGGRIIVWSDESTLVAGALIARGGLLGGSGGFAETSGKQTLTVLTAPDLGAGGQWLLDPYDVTIGKTGSNYASSGTGTALDPLLFEANADNATVDVATIQAALVGGTSLTITTGSGGAQNGDITWLAGNDLDINGTGSNTLTLSAARNITLNSSITDSVAGGDGLTLNLNATAGTVTLNGNFTLGTSNLVLGSTQALVLPTITAGNLSVTTTGGTITQAVGQTITATGTVTLNATTGNDITLANSGNALGTGISATAHNLTLATNGVLTLTAFTGAADSAISLSATNGVTVNAALNTTGAFTVNADSDANDAGTYTQNAALTVGTTSLRAAAIAGLGGANKLTASGDVTIAPSNLGTIDASNPNNLRSIRIGDTASNSLNLTYAQIDAIDTGSHTLVIGNSQLSGDIVFGTAGTFKAGSKNLHLLTARQIGVGSDGLSTTGTLTLEAVNPAFDPNNNKTAPGAIGTSSGALTASAIALRTDNAIGSSGTPLGLLKAAGAGLSLAATSGYAGVFITSTESVTLQDVAGIGNTAAGTFQVTAATLAVQGPITTTDTLSASNTGLVTLNATGTTLSIAAAGDITASGAVSLTGAGGISTAGDIGTSNDAVDLHSPVTLIGVPVIIDAGSGAVTFDSTVDGGSVLTVNSTGATRFGAAVGSTTALASLTTNAGGTTALNGGSVKTTKAQTYNDAVTLGADTTLTGSTVTLAGSVTGAGKDLTVNGSTEFDNSVSGVDVLTVNGGATINTASITSSGAQIWDGAITLAANATLASTGSGNIGFGSTLDGAFALTVNTAGTTTFSGRVGGTTALTSLTTDTPGSVVFDIPIASLVETSIHTSGDQTYGELKPSISLGRDTFLKSDAGTVTLGSGGGSIVTNGHVLFVSDKTSGGCTQLAGTLASGAPGGCITLLGDTTFNAGAADISFAGAIDGGYTLTINTSGAITFAGAVGGTTMLASLVTDAGGTTTINTASIRTSGVQTYGDDLVLGADTTLTGSTVTFAGSVTGAGKDLAVSGDAVFGGSVAGVDVLAVSGAATINTASVSTGGTQTWTGAVTLGADTTLASTGGGNIGFGSSVDGNHGLTVNTSGVTSFDGTVGSKTALASVTTDAGGTTQLTGGTVTTTGAQRYDDAVSLLAATTFASTGSGNIGFGSIVNGSFALTVNTAGVTSFGSTVGATKALASLTTDAGGSTNLNGNVSTTGAQNYGDAVTLAAAVTLASSGGSNIGFASTVNGAFALTVNTTGTTGFGGAVGSNTALVSLATNAGGTTAINGGAVTTTGAQTYNDAVTLGADATLASTGSGTIGFAGAVDGGFALTVNTQGSTTFGAAVGGTTALVSLTTDTGGTTVLNGGTVSTSGGQSYNDAVTLGKATTLASTGSGNIGFNRTVDGGFALTVNTAGTTTFSDRVGGTTALASLTTDAPGGLAFSIPIVDLTQTSIRTTGDQTYGEAKTSISLGHDTFLKSDSGTVTLGSGGGQVATNGHGLIVTDKTTGSCTQVAGTFGLGGAFGCVTLIGDTTVNASAADISFGSIDGGFALTVNSTGATTFGGAVGTGTALASLTTDAGGTTVLNGGAITTTSGQSYNDAVTLGKAATLTSSGGSNIGFASSVDGAFALTVDTAGTTSFGGAVGGTTALASLTTNAGGTTTLNGNVSTSGAQSYNDAVTLGAAATLTSSGGGNIGFASSVDGGFALTVDTAGTTSFGGAVGGTTALASLTTNAGGTTTLNGNVSTTGAQSYNDAVTLGAAATLASTGSGNIGFASSVDGGFALTVDTAGTTSFGGAVGATTALASLTTNAGGTTTLNGGAVTTTGAQTYGDAVTLGAATTLASTGSSNIGFASSVDGGFALTVDTAGATSFGGAVGATTALASLTTNAGGSTTLNGNVSTTGAQSYGDAVTLGAAATLASSGSGNIGFAGSVDGGFALTVDTAGTTSFGGAVGGTTALASLTTNAGGTTTLNGGAVTTSGAQTYGDAVTLGAAATLASSGGGNIGFAGSVDGAFALTVDTAGTTSFGGAVGGTTALASLTTNAGGSTTLNGGAVTTSGAQSYGDAVTLGAAATLASSGGGNIGFAGSVDGAFALTVDTAGTTSFGGAVGGTTALASLTTNVGGTTTLNGNVSTSGAQTYNDAVTLGANTTLTSSGGSNIGFGSTVNGAFALTVDTAGTTSFGGAVGSTTALASLTTNAGGTTTLNGNVSTTGAQSYGDAVTLGKSATLTSSGGSNIGFASSVDGAFALTVDTAGTTSFGGAVGGTTALASLTTNAGGTTTLNGNVSTTGAQTYNDAVTLGANTTLTSSGGSNIGFGSSVDGGFALTVDTAGATSFGAAVGATTALASLMTNAGGSTTLNGNVSTTGAQSYNDAVTLGANTTLTSSGGSNIGFAGSVDGAFALTVDTAGTTSFGGAVGGTTALASLTTNAGGSTTLNGGAVTTSGAQGYGDAVTLGAATTLASTGSGNIGFGNTVNGAFALTVNTAGTTSFGGAVGGTTALASLTTNAGGTTAIDGSAITTTGAQTYGDAVTLGADTTLTASTASFAAVDGASHMLSFGFSDPTNLTGSTFSNLAALDSFGSGVLGLSGTFTTTGTQHYAGAITLLGDTAFIGTDLSFDGTVSGPHLLTLSGNDIDLAAVTVDALSQSTGTGTTAFNGPVTVTGAGGVDVTTHAIVVGAALTSSGGGNIALNATTGSAPGRTIEIGADITANGAGVTLVALDDLFVTPGTNPTIQGQTGTINGNVLGNGGDVLLDFTNDLTLTGGNVTDVHNLTRTGGGDTYVSGTIATTGFQHYDAGNVFLSANTTFVASDLAFAGSVSGAHVLTIGQAGTTTASATFQQDVNVSRLIVTAQVVDLALLGNTTTTATNATTFNNTGVLTLGGDGSDVLDFGGNLVATAPSRVDVGGTISVPKTPSRAMNLGNVALLADTVLSGGSGHFTTMSGNGFALTLDFGDTYTFGTLNGTLGRLTSNGALRIGGNVQVTGEQVYAGPLVLTADTVLGASGNGSAATFGSTIDSDSTATPRALTVNAGGVTAFNGPIGATAALASLTTDTAGTLALNTGSVTTTGQQSYGEPVTLGFDTTLTASAVRFLQALNAAGHALRTSADLSLLAGATGLTTLDVGATASLAGSIVSSGDQLYRGPVALAAGTQLLAGGAVHAFGLVSGDTLYVRAAGDVTFDDTAVATIDVESSGTGSIDITERDGAALRNVRASNGSVRITSTTGNLRAQDVFASGDATIATLAGDIIVDTVRVGGTANLSAGTPNGEQIGTFAYRLSGIGNIFVDTADGRGGYRTGVGTDGHVVAGVAINVAAVQSIGTQGLPVVLIAPGGSLANFSVQPIFFSALNGGSFLVLSGTAVNLNSGRNAAQEQSALDNRTLFNFDPALLNPNLSLFTLDESPLCLPGDQGAACGSGG